MGVFICSLYAELCGDRQLSVSLVAAVMMKPWTYAMLSRGMSLCVRHKSQGARCVHQLLSWRLWQPGTEGDCEGDSPWPPLVLKSLITRL